MVQYAPVCTTRQAAGRSRLQKYRLARRGHRSKRPSGVTATQPLCGCPRLSKSGSFAATPCWSIAACGAPCARSKAVGRQCVCQRSRRANPDDTSPIATRRVAQRKARPEQNPICDFKASARDNQSSHLGLQNRLNGQRSTGVSAPAGRVTCDDVGEHDPLRDGASLLVLVIHEKHASLYELLVVVLANDLAPYSRDVPGQGRLCREQR